MVIKGSIPWDEMRKRAEEYRETLWSQRALFIPGEKLLCPGCGVWCESEREVVDWYGDTLEPDEDTALAPVAECHDCDLRLVAPYGVVFTEQICHECHDDMWGDEVYANGHWFCSHECHSEWAARMDCKPDKGQV